MTDAGSLSRRNYRLVAEKGGTPYVKPKENSHMKAKGCYAWKSMVNSLLETSTHLQPLLQITQRVEAG